MTHAPDSTRTAKHGDAPSASAAAPHAPTHIATLSELQQRVGETLGSSDWVLIEQSRIDRFAQATGDDQWIHVDPVRAAAGPYGRTVAHGFLTLSLLPELARTAFAIDDVTMGINYGLNRVRFPAPVRVGERLRAQFRLDQYEPLPGGAQLTLTVTMTVDGQDRPVCVAESVSRRFTAAANATATATATATAATAGAPAPAGAAPHPSR